MNYIWELAIQAKRIGSDPDNIVFIFDDDFSAYMELSFQDMNETGIPFTVAINPYYRYYEVFKELLNPDLSLDDNEFREMLLDLDFIRNNLPEEVFKSLFYPNVPKDEREYKELLANDEFMRSHVIEELREKYLADERHGQRYLRDEKINKLRYRDLKSDSPMIIGTAFDIIAHHLVDIDVHMGMNKREYYINFIINDMHQGYFGSNVKKHISVFTRDEQVIIANNLIALYTIGEEIHLLRDSVSRIFKGSYIFSNAEERDEVVFFLRTAKTDEKEEKMALLQYLFLPFKCDCEIYWEKIFGILDVPELMIMGNMMQY